MINVRIWGTRGSLPVPGPDTIRYGGNTACVTLEVEGEPLTILDAGTGIAALARTLGRRTDFTCNLFLGHLHWDHLIGLPFFFTADAADSHIHIYGPEGEHGLRRGIDSVMAPPGFPIKATELDGWWQFHDMGNETVEIGSLQVTARAVRHRGPTLGFRVEGFGATLAYISDHGPGAEQRGPEQDDLVPEGVLDLVSGADVLFHDAQHTPEQYARFRHFGHCTPEYAVRVAKAGEVKELLLFHHDPGRDDAAVDMMVELAHTAADQQGYTGTIRAAAEGDTFTLGTPARSESTGSQAG
jgi:ribonuclease BN (tRNA processing enzyme)